MGQGLAAFYRNHVKNSWKTAFFSAIVFGLIAHLYKFTNYLPNHDALYCVFINPPNAIGSGRWLLDIACNLSSPFDAPWIRGLVSLLWIGLTAAVLVQVLELELGQPLQEQLLRLLLEQPVFPKPHEQR